MLAPLMISSPPCLIIIIAVFNVVPEDLKTGAFTREKRSACPEGRITLFKSGADIVWVLW
jgi:hypothetical protein